MSKSHSTEIISVLYLIAGLLTHGWFRWFLFGAAAENLLESMIWAYKERKS